MSIDASSRPAPKSDTPAAAGTPARLKADVAIRQATEPMVQRDVILPTRHARGFLAVLGQRPARQLRRHGRLLAFVLMVIAPTLAAFIYLAGFASPQYVSEFRFGVRSSNNLRNDSSAIFQGMASASQIGLDSYVVVQFIKSRQLVDALRAEFDFKALFAQEKFDWLSRLDAKAQSEGVQRYWDNLVDPFFDLTTGSVSVRVRAFTPDDAQNLAKSILTRSEKLVNDLSLRAREDAVKGAQEEVARSEARLRQTLASIRTFRDAQARINPEKEADNRMAALGRMRDELAASNAELSVRQSYMTENSPTVKANANRIRALAEQIALAEGLLTKAGADPAAKSRALSADMGAYDELESERRFAEDYYKTRLASLERARAEADRQSSYLATFVQPTLPEEPLYPKIWQSTAIVLVAGFGLWIFGLIALRSVREHG